MFWQWPVRTLGRLTLMFVKLRSSWGLRLTSTDYTSLSGQLKGPAGQSRTFDDIMAVFIY